MWARGISAFSLVTNTRELACRRVHNQSPLTQPDCGPLRDVSPLLCGHPYPGLLTARSIYRLINCLNLLAASSPVRQTNQLAAWLALLLQRPGRGHLHCQQQRHPGLPYRLPDRAARGLLAGEGDAAAHRDGRWGGCWDINTWYSKAPQRNHCRPGVNCVRSWTPRVAQS